MKYTSPLSYSNSIIASTALVMSAAALLYDRFDIQNPTQLAVYAITGTLVGTVIKKMGDRNKKSELLKKLE